MRHICLEHMPDGFDVERTFGNKWVRGSMKRKNISLQKKTNCKSTSLFRKMHKVVNYHYFIIFMMANPDNEYPQWNVNTADFNSAVASNENDPLIEDSSGLEDTSSVMDAEQLEDDVQSDSD